MAKDKYRIHDLFVRAIMMVLILLFAFEIKGQSVYASDPIQVEGKLKELTYAPLAKIDYSDSKKYKNLSLSTTHGVLRLSGEVESNDKQNGVPSFTVANDNIVISYTFPKEYFQKKSGEYYLNKYAIPETVGDTKFKKDIDSGALIVQVSPDGEEWIDVVAVRDAFKDNKNYYKSLYTPKSIELTNGYYYRVIVAYELKRDYKNSKGKEETDIIVRCEIYDFYLHTSENNTTDSANSQVLGTLVNAGSKAGYAERKDIDLKDPHYGWELGKFYVKGYTRLTNKTDGSPVFLKNVGDTISLSFKLEQDIDRLNGQKELSIAADNKGADQYFQIQKMNMGKGALIVRYTDEDGVKHKPVVYSNFLEANAKKGADTKIEAYEEGDYEVALDYMIKKSQVIPIYTSYRISFNFSIRNGNCMVYPFDIDEGSELSDMAITENGFRLDLAKSRYLNIDVTFNELTESGYTYKEDRRWNRPAKDGDSYTEEGIYTFDVKNLYTGENTKKTIFVGTDPALYALSVNRISVDELNGLLKEGYEFDDYGELFLVEDEMAYEELSDEEYREYVLDKVELAEQVFAEIYSVDLEEYDPKLSREENLVDNYVCLIGTVNNMYIEEVMKEDDELIYEASIYLEDEDDGDLWVFFVELQDGAFDKMYDACVGKDIYIEGVLLSVDETVPIVYGDYIELMDSDEDVNQYFAPWVIPE